MKFIIVCIVTFILSACASNVPTHVSYMERAENAISEKNWEVAYRFLEDFLNLNQDPEKNKAEAYLLKYSEILKAGANTFSIASISERIKQHGLEPSIDIERRRLETYKTVATRHEYETAKSNIDTLAFELDARRVQEEIIKKDKLAAKEKEEKEKREQAMLANLNAERERLALKLALTNAATAAKFSCKDKTECDKAFSLTQIFISDNTDMKIQFASETIIETYNPNEPMKIGAKAVKMPSVGQSAEILFSATCREEKVSNFIELCDKKLLLIYRKYPKYLRTQMRP